MIAIIVLIDSALPGGSACETTFPRSVEISSHSRFLESENMRHPN